MLYLEECTVYTVRAVALRMCVLGGGEGGSIRLLHPSSWHKNLGVLSLFV